MTSIKVKKDRGAIPADTRRHNRGLVLQSLLHEGPLSRSDLALATGMTKATMTDLMGVLVSDGLAVESGTREGGIGRPAILVELNRDHRHLIALDLSSHHSFEGALLGLDSTVIARRSVPLHGERGNAALGLLVQLIEDLKDAAGRPLLGVAIGTPGRVRNEGALVDAPALGWRDVDLLNLAESAVGGPAMIVNDANLAAVAERRFGGGADDLILVRISRGVGAGILIEGRLQEGQRSIAGEIGHVTVGDGSGPLCACGRTGCLEAWISVPQLSASRSTAREGDLVSAGKRLGFLLAPMIAALDTTEVVLSGPADLLSGSFLESASRTVRLRTLEGLQPDVPIRMAKAADAVIVGAAVKLVERELDIA